MLRQLAKKGLRNVGLLEPALALKRRFLPADLNFRPCTPNLSIAVTQALVHLKEHGPTTGDYLEFGIFRGYTLWYTQQIAQVLGVTGMRYFGFDSFQGLPGLHSAKDQGGEFSEGQYAAFLPEVKENLEYFGIDWNITRLIPGMFNQSLTPALRETEKLETCRLAVIDCDLYSSTVDALSFLGPLITNGTIILFDDWNSYDKDNNKGERAAFGEFLQKNSHLRAKPFVEFGNHGASFIFANH